MADWVLIDFIRESNRIEGILREPKDAEIAAHEALLSRDRLTVHHLAAFVAQIQPGARLRDTQGMNVRVGSHIAPPGGPDIAVRLDSLLSRVNDGAPHPYWVHVEYETLHPFMDGNGRSGRALWLWMRGGYAPLGFLHQFYYETLQHSRLT